MALNDPRAPASRPFAVLSDIHGNLPALEAVLGELERMGVRDVFAAGDHLLGGEKPLEVWRLLQQVGARCTRGVADEALAQVDPESLHPANPEEEASAERFAETRAAIGDLVVEQLRRLPERLRLPLIDGGEMLMVHGSPADPTSELSHDLEDEELEARLADDPAELVVCGASHVPFDRTVGDVRVVNVGSVGAAPEGRVAHFTVVTPAMEGPQVEQQWVEY